MTVHNEIAAVVALAGLPVRPAGATPGVMPCITMTPTDPEPESRARLWIEHRYDVTVMVARGEDIDQLQLLEEYVDDVCEQISRSTLSLVRIRYRPSAGDAEIAYHGMTITVGGNGRRFC